MRWIVLLAVLLAVAGGLGWFYVRDTDDRIEIIIDKEEILTDTEEAVERGREWVDEAAEDREEPSPEDDSDIPKEAGEPQDTETHSPETQPQGAIP